MSVCRLGQYSLLSPSRQRATAAPAAHCHQALWAQEAAHPPHAATQSLPAAVLRSWLQVYDDDVDIDTLRPAPQRVSAPPLWTTEQILRWGIAGILASGIAGVSIGVGLYQILN